MSIKINHNFKTANRYRRDLVLNLPFIASFTDTTGLRWDMVLAVAPSNSETDLFVIDTNHIHRVSVYKDHVIQNYKPVSLVINVFDLDITIAL